MSSCCSTCPCWHIYPYVTLGKVVFMDKCTRRGRKSHIFSCFSYWLLLDAHRSPFLLQKLLASMSAGLVPVAPRHARPPRGQRILVRRHQLGEASRGETQRRCSHPARSICKSDHPGACFASQLVSAMNDALMEELYRRPLPWDRASANCSRDYRSRGSTMGSTTHTLLVIYVCYPMPPQMDALENPKMVNH